MCSIVIRRDPRTRESEKSRVLRHPRLFSATPRVCASRRRETPPTSLIAFVFLLLCKKDKMASLLNSSLRAAESSICRRCAALPARRTFAFNSIQAPKHEVLSRPIISSRKPPTTRNRPLFRATPRGKKFSSTTRRTYKTVEEAKSRYKLGVSSHAIKPIDAI